MPSACLSVPVYVGCCSWLLYSEVAPNAWLHYFGCGAMGMLTSYVFIMSTQYNTDYAYYPVQSIAMASTTGHGTNIITGATACAAGGRSAVLWLHRRARAVLFPWPQRVVVVVSVARRCCCGHEVSRRACRHGQHLGAVIVLAGPHLWSRWRTQRWPVRHGYGTCRCRHRLSSGITLPICPS